jgi:hypothetical protein
VKLRRNDQKSHIICKFSKKRGYAISKVDDFILSDGINDTFRSASLNRQSQYRQDQYYQIIICDCEDTENRISLERAYFEDSTLNFLELIFGKSKGNTLHESGSRK